MGTRLGSSLVALASAVSVAGLLGSCAPEEQVTVTPESTTKTIAAGSSDEVPLSVLLDDSGFAFVGLPVDVRVIGLDSDVPDELTLHSDPTDLTLDDREAAESAVVTVGVLAGTAPGEYHARIVPDSSNEFLEGGDGLELTVIVPAGGAPEPTAAPTTSGTPSATSTPGLSSPTPTPTEECDPDFDDCDGDGDCDPEFEDCDGDGVVDDEE